MERTQQVKVKDAKRRLFFEITSEDGREGIALDPGGCAVGCALKHTLPGLREVHVGAAVTILTVDDPATGETVKWRHATTEVLRKGLNKFDETKDSEGHGRWDLPPGIYHLNVIPRHRATGARKGQRRYPKDRALARPAVPLNPRFIAFCESRSRAKTRSRGSRPTTKDF